MTQPDPSDIAEIVRLSLREDIGTGDITAELIPIEKSLSATILCKDVGVFCGRAWADEVFRQVDSSLQVDWQVDEGAAVSAGTTIAQIKGNARSLLSAERCALNFLQTLSATASISRHYATLVQHTNVQLLDTRKTLPGLRSAQKYAVHIGGCFNHRMGLYDAFLIKENHIAACGSIAAAVSAARSLHSDKPVEVEVRSLEELSEANTAKADIVMLDNFTTLQLSQAVKLNEGQAKLEASGGIDDETLVSVAETGVDYISLGALTKNCKALDLSLLID